jgi:hypothetical protein
MSATMAERGPAPQTGECAACRTVGRMQMCSRCKAVKYCSAACQRTAWKAHKATYVMAVTCVASNTCACLKHALLHAGPPTAVSDADRNEGCMATALLAKPHSRRPRVAKVHTPRPFISQEELACPCSRGLHGQGSLHEVYSMLDA